MARDVQTLRTARSKDGTAIAFERGKLGSFFVAGPVTPSCGRGPVGAPAAREGSSGRGRTSWTPTNGGAPSGARTTFAVGGLCGEGCRRFRTCRLSEWSHKHPFGAASRWHGANDRVSGTGLLSQMLERGRRPAHAAGASAPGAW